MFGCVPASCQSLSWAEINLDDDRLSVSPTFSVGPSVRPSAVAAVLSRSVDEGEEEDDGGDDDGDGVALPLSLARLYFAAALARPSVSPAPARSPARARPTSRD